MLLVWVSGLRQRCKMAALKERHFQIMLARSPFNLRSYASLRKSLNDRELRALRQLPASFSAARNKYSKIPMFLNKIRNISRKYCLTRMPGSVKMVFGCHQKVRLLVDLLAGATSTPAMCQSDARPASGRISLSGLRWVVRYERSIFKKTEASKMANH